MYMKLVEKVPELWYPQQAVVYRLTSRVVMNILVAKGGFSYG
jgi:hypothetical protein